jgi:hypothetical protein
VSKDEKMNIFVQLIFPSLDIILMINERFATTIDTILQQNLIQMKIIIPNNTLISGGLDIVISVKNTLVNIKFQKQFFLKKHQVFDQKSFH